MNGNHATFEIKSCSADLNGIKKDVRTLSRFVRDVGYQRAIYLVYGDALDRIANKIRVAAAALNLGVGIELWLHHQAGVPAEPRGTV
jgi:hypothetical protein